MIKKNKRDFEHFVSVLREARKDDLPNEISEKDRLREDLGMNSFDFMIMLYLLEDEWGVRLKHENIASVSTAGDLYRLLSEAETDEKVQ